MPRTADSKFLGNSLGTQESYLSLKSKNLLESNPPKSRFLVRELTVFFVLSILRIHAFIYIYIYIYIYILVGALICEHDIEFPNFDKI